MGYLRNLHELRKVREHILCSSEVAAQLTEPKMTLITYQHASRFISMLVELNTQCCPVMGFFDYSGILHCILVFIKWTHKFV